MGNINAINCLYSNAAGQSPSVANGAFIMLKTVHIFIKYGEHIRSISLSFMFSSKAMNINVPSVIFITAELGVYNKEA